MARSWPIMARSWPLIIIIIIIIISKNLVRGGHGKFLPSQDFGALFTMRCFKSRVFQGVSLCILHWDCGAQAYPNRVDVSIDGVACTGHEEVIAVVIAVVAVVITVAIIIIIMIMMASHHPQPFVYKLLSKSPGIVD